MQVKALSPGCATGSGLSTAGYWWEGEEQRPQENWGRGAPGQAGWHYLITHSPALPTGPTWTGGSSLSCWGHSRLWGRAAGVCMGGSPTQCQDLGT